MARLGFYSPNNYPVQSGDIAAALNALISEMVAGSTLQPAMAPLLSAIPKSVTPLDVIRWSYRDSNRVSNVGTLESPALYSNFPGTDNGNYAASNLQPLELTIGGTKLWDIIKINSDEISVAMASGNSNEVRMLFESRYATALSGLIRTIGQHLVQGKAAITVSPINGIESVFAGNSYAGLTHTLASYTGATNGVDYFLSWRPTVGTWAQATGTMTFNDGHTSAATQYVLPDGSNGIASAFQFFDRYLRNKGKSYNLIVTTPDIAFAYSKQYAMRTTITLINGQMVTAENGFGNASFRGLPILEDNTVPANTVYFIDTNKVRLYTRGNPSATPNQSSAFGGIYFGSGELASDTITTRRFELVCVPQFVVSDTTGLSKLSINAVDIFAEDYPAS
jgi:hypothetical protein